MNTEIIDKFKKYYSNPMLCDVSLLSEIYADHLRYEDPICKIQGLENYQRMQQKFLDELAGFNLWYGQQSILHDKAFLSWECEIDLKLVRKKVHVSGLSVIEVTDKVVWQRNYFDGGAFLYEPLPLIGGLLRWTKRMLIRNIQDLSVLPTPVSSNQE